MLPKFEMCMECYVDENGRLSYKIFADSEGLRLYLQKNKGKTRKDRKPVFIMKEYREYVNM